MKLKNLAVILAVVSIVAGCGGGKRGSVKQQIADAVRGDGPPVSDVDISKVRNAVPRYEPRSRYGNPPSYVVFGKRYYVMKSGRGYVRRGIASWYGKKFHGRRTSSGEPYNMLAMTAAHKSLPLPSYVRVTNLENNKTIIVKVNDRGPFAHNRVIDLSYAAAYKLGMLRKGTAYVQVSVIEPGVTDLPMIARKESRKRELRRRESPGSADAPRIEKNLSMVSELPSFNTVRPITRSAPKATRRQPLILSARTPLPSGTSRYRRSGVNRVARGYTSDRNSNNSQKPYRFEAPVRANRPAKNTAKNKYRVFIQIGAFRNQANARRLYKKLLRFSYPFLSIHQTFRDNRKLYRVRIGPLASVKQVDHITNDLERNGFRLTRVMIH